LLFSSDAESADAAVLSLQEQRCGGTRSKCLNFPKEFDAADLLHCGVVDENRCVT